MPVDELLQCGGEAANIQARSLEMVAEGDGVSARPTVELLLRGVMETVEGGGKPRQRQRRTRCASPTGDPTISQKRS